MNRDSYSDPQAHASFQPRSSQPAIDPTQLSQPVHHSSSTGDLGAKWLNKASGWMADKLQTAQNFVNDLGDAIAPDQMLPGLKGTARPSLPQARKMQGGDTLRDIAKDKLGSGSRWTELQKKDGGEFTEQEARRLQIGTSVYLPAIKPANSFQLAPTIQAQPSDLGANPNQMALEKVENGDRSIDVISANNSLLTQPESAHFSGADLIKAVQSNPEGVSDRELPGGTKSENLPGSSAAFYKTSQGSSPQLQAKGISDRELADGSTPTNGNTQRDAASDNQNLLGLSDNEYLAQHVIGDAAAGYFMGNPATKLTKSNSNLPKSNSNLPDAWVSKQGSQPGSTSWTEKGRDQFRKRTHATLDRKIKANLDSPLKEFAEKDENGKWKLKPEYQAGHTASTSSGMREMFAIEHKDFNEGTSNDKKKLKQQGTFLRKRAISIDGIPVEIQTARGLEEKGILPKGTVEKARLHPGWARTTPVTKPEVDKIKDGLYRKQLENERKDLRKVKVKDRSPQQQERLNQLEGQFKEERQLKNERKGLRKVKDRSPQQQERLKQLKGQLEEVRVRAPSGNALTGPNDQKAIRRLEGMVDRAELTTGGNWRGTKVTGESVDVVRDQLIRSELRQNNNLTPKDRQALQGRLAAGKATDADLAKLKPENKARIDELRDIVKVIDENDKKKTPDKHPFHDRSELYAFYDEKLRESVTDTKNPARGRDVTDSGQTGAPKQRGGTAPFIAYRDKPDEANPEKKRSVNPADRSPRQTPKKPVVSPSNPSSEAQKPKPSVVSTTTPSPNNERRTPPTRSPRIEPPARKPPAIPSGAQTIAKSGGKALGKFVKPLGFAVDAYELGNAMYEDGGIGQNTKEVAKDAAISWGSAAVGAGVGFAVGGPPGALVGGIVGGLAPSAVSFTKGLFD